MSQVRWLSPSPLWDDLVRSPGGLRAPALLRFAGDDFVDQYQSVLAGQPRSLRGFVAKPETWRKPAAGLDAPPFDYPLRLYQPVHGRFYLVAASLACRVPGFPEHTVDAAKGEVVAFVLRRLTYAPSGAETEWAWIKRADGSAGWAPAPAQAVAADEELHPMFASTYAGTGGLRSAAVTRRVFAGLVPASRRETFAHGRELPASGAAPAAAAAGSLDDPRVLEFQRAVLDPWAEMVEWYDAQVKRDEDDDRATGPWESALDSAETSSAFLMADLHDFLRRELPKVADAIDGDPDLTKLGAQRPLYDALAGLTVRDRNGGNAVSLPAALRYVKPFIGDLETLAVPTQRLPDGYTIARVLVGDPVEDDVAANDAGLDWLFARLPGPPWELDDPQVGVRRLKRLVMDALAVEGPAPAATPEQLPTRAPKPNPDGEDWFTVRCVYLRPHCGRKAPPVVSDRTERFRLVSYFDPDAPARKLRVALPVDTSPATLRKYNRNVAFVLSDQLRKQMSRATDMKKLIDGEVGDEDGGISFGVICSFSIPIITICALIILMILVSLLNIIFWWLPLFRICFPAPKLK